MPGHARSSSGPHRKASDRRRLRSGPLPRRSGRDQTATVHPPASSRAPPMRAATPTRRGASDRLPRRGVLGAEHPATVWTIGDAHTTSTAPHPASHAFTKGRASASLREAARGRVCFARESTRHLAGQSKRTRLHPHVAPRQVGVLRRTSPGSGATCSQSSTSTGCWTPGCRVAESFSLSTHELSGGKAATAR
jgi:hypothetical protein